MKFVKVEIVVGELVENWSKIDRKLVGRWSKIGRKLVENWPEVVRKLVENCSRFSTTFVQKLVEIVRKFNVLESGSRREFVGNSSKFAGKQRSVTAFPTVQIDLQVRGKDVSFPYHHALTVSSLGSDCQACTAPLLNSKLRGKTKGIESAIFEKAAACFSHRGLQSVVQKHCEVWHRVSRCFHTHTQNGYDSEEQLTRFAFKLYCTYSQKQILCSIFIRGTQSEIWHRISKAAGTATTRRGMTRIQWRGTQCTNPCQSPWWTSHKQCIDPLIFRNARVWRFQSAWAVKTSECKGKKSTCNMYDMIEEYWRYNGLGDLSSPWDQHRRINCRSA